MKPEFAELLAEPVTGAALELDVTESDGDDVVEGTLTSQETGRTYPIHRGIPRFVPADNYAESFGFQWNKFRGVQLDSENRADHSRQRFDAETGWTGDELEGKLVLDAGCGAGRFAEIAAARGANLVAMDYSSAVEATAETLRPYPNANVVQGNLLEPPFRPGTFEYAYCIGVVQHTPDPPQVIRNILEMVQDGGQFALTIYGRRPWTKLNGKYLVRPLTKRMDDETLLKVLETTMPVAYPVADRLFRLPVVGRAFRFAIPIAHWPDHKGLTKEQQYMESVQDTFDALSPEYDQPMSPGEVEAVLREVGVRDSTFRTRIPVNVTGRR